MKKIKIKSFILEEEEDRGVIEEISLEEFKKLPKVSEEEWEEEKAALRVPALRMEMDTKIAEVNVSEEEFNKLCHIFKLYGIPYRAIENGVEIDIREKEPYPYRKRMPEP